MSTDDVRTLGGTTYSLKFALPVYNEHTITGSRSMSMRCSLKIQSPD